MATGPSHYREAERLLTSADIALGQYEERGWEQKRVMADSLTAQAQVHVLLALTAAKALGGLGATDPEWQAAAGQPPQDGDTGE